MSDISAHLSLAGLSKQYGDGPPAVAGITLSARRGEFLTLLGPSGCGKTTALRMIAGLVPPSDGRIHVDGKDITHTPTHQRNMGMVFQNYALFPHLTIARNVAFGLEMRGVDKGAIGRRVAESLGLVRLGGLEHRLPKQLSGGQQQRVALARALVIEPSVLLLDEPLSNLDAKLREELRAEIREIQSRLGITAVFVTHDQTEALTMSDRIAVMNAGRVEQIGTPIEIYERPATMFVATFIGRTNRVAATVVVSGADDSTLDVAGRSIMAPGRMPVGQQVTAMVRPHRMRLTTGAQAPRPGINRLDARIEKTVFAGEIIQYTVEAAGSMLMVDSHTSSSPSGRLPDAPAVVEWDVADTLVFEL
jgi:putative spermidine/putrescine transport system ATP-binding protein